MRGLRLRRCVFYLKLLIKYFHLTLKTNLQYKFDRAMISLAVFVREASGVLVIILLLNAFKSIKGWEMNELLFLYSFLFLSYSIFVFFFTGIRDFEDLVYSGELDVYLTRPINTLYQIIVSKIDYTAAIGHGILGVILFYKTANSIGISWSIQNIVILVIFIISGALIQADIFMFASCFSFWTIKTTNIRNLLFFNSRKFAAYPITFYGSIVQIILKYVIPFAFVNYFPAQYFLMKDNFQNRNYALLSPIIAFLLFYVVNYIWKRGLKRYASTGNAHM